MENSRGGGGGRILVSIFAGYLPLAAKNPYHFMVYFMVNYRPHVSHFRVNVLLATPTYSLSVYAYTLHKAI